MQLFIITLFAAGVLVAAAIPGYLLVKSRILPEHSIKDFSKILIYITQPCLAIYTFQSTEYSVEKLISLGVFALISLLLQCLMLAGAYLVLRHKYENPLYRILTVATTMGNCAFFGIPVLEALFPSVSGDIMVYTTVYALSMNVIGWTVGSAIISGDSRYVSFKKVMINPALIGTAVALLLFVTRIPLTFTLPGTDSEFTLLFDIIVAGARMATPLSMLIMGMRLGTMRIGSLFVDPRVYITILVKQMLMPFVAFLMMLALPLDGMVEKTFFVISACPVASVVLNYSELVGQGQKEAANTVLLGTMGSVITLPVMALLINFI